MTADMLALVGQEAWPPQTVEVRETDILRYHEATGDDDVRRDADGTLEAPPMFLPPFAVGGAIGEDGRRARPGERRVAPPGLERRLMGGCEIAFGEPMRAGERITASTTIADIFEKQGSTGSMVFVVTETRYVNGLGADKRTERWTTIYR